MPTGARGQGRRGPGWWADAGDKVDRQARLGDADDYTKPDGIRILNCAQAQKKAEDGFKEAVQLLELERGGEVVPIGYDQVFAMEKAVKAAGIPPVTFHELRHTDASGLINAGVPLMFVAKQLGHADNRMGERHYGHIARKALSASIEKLSPKLGLFEPTVGTSPKTKRAGRNGKE